MTENNEFSDTIANIIKKCNRKKLVKQQQHDKTLELKKTKNRQKEKARRKANKKK